MAASMAMIGRIDINPQFFDHGVIKTMFNK